MVIRFPARLETGKTHDRTATPSTWTVQAPHNAIPQPNFVPVRCITSRRAQSRGTSGARSTLRSTPLILSKYIALSFRAGVEDQAIPALFSAPCRSLAKSAAARNNVHAANCRRLFSCAFFEATHRTFYIRIFMRFARAQLCKNRRSSALTVTLDLITGEN